MPITEQLVQSVHPVVTNCILIRTEANIRLKDSAYVSITYNFFRTLEITCVHISQHNGCDSHQIHEFEWLMYGLKLLVFY